MARNHHENNTLVGSVVEAQVQLRSQITTMRTIAIAIILTRPTSEMACSEIGRYRPSFPGMAIIACASAMFRFWRDCEPI